MDDENRLSDMCICKVLMPAWTQQPAWKEKETLKTPTQILLSVHLCRRVAAADQPIFTGESVGHIVVKLLQALKIKLFWESSPFFSKQRVPRVFSFTKPNRTALVNNLNRRLETFEVLPSVW